MIELRHLQHLLALAKHGNFSRAAKEVGLTQPALSRSIQALEGLVGAPLLARHRTGVEPTEMGRLVLKHAESVSASARDLSRDIRMAQGLELGELRIGTSPMDGSLVVGPVLGQLTHQHPSLAIKVVVGPPEELPERLQRREIDMAVADRVIFQGQSGLATQPLVARSAVMVCRPGHPLTSQAPLRPQDLSAYPYVGPRLGHADISRASDTAAGAGQPPLIECDNAAVAQDILLHSDALSSLPRAIARQRAEDGQWVMLDVPGLDLPCQLAVAWLSTRSLSQSGQRFLDLLAEADRRLGV